MNAPQDHAAAKKAAFEANKLSKRLHRQVGQAITDFNMIEAGDKVMVSKFAGNFVRGTGDGKEYRIVNDKDIFCRITEDKQEGYVYG
jgi:co-chaperonin GroES (HSP10)